jgi:hypothetical protein
MIGADVEEKLLMAGQEERRGTQALLTLAQVQPQRFEVAMAALQA